MIPEPWEFALLALATFRVWKLLGEDDFLARPRDWAIERLGPRLDDLLACPWCAGWWIGLAWWIGWLVEPKWALVAATPWALSGVVGLVGTGWSKLSD